VHGTNQDMTFRYFTEENLDADFEELDTAEAPAVLAAFWEEVSLVRDAVRDLDLDHVVPSHADHPERVRNIRWIYVHMIEEYARHNGHADLLRERIDGVTGD
jgi:murein tripeptide amidase MpaA